MDAGAVGRPDNLDSMVREIASHVPRMRAACRADVEFWDWFAGEVDSVRRNAGSPEEAEKLVDLLKRAASATENRSPGNQADPGSPGWPARPSL